MKRQEYYDMSDTVKRLTRVFKNNVEVNIATFPLNDFVYALLGATPDLHSAFYLSQEDEEGTFRQQEIRYIKKTILHDFKYAGTRKNLTLLSDALFERGLSFGVTPLDIPDSLWEKIKGNLDNYDDGQEILLEIFQHWVQQFKKYKHDEIFDDRVTVNPLKNKVRKYVPAQTEEQYWEERESQSVDTSFYEDDDSRVSSENSITFDEDGSNWSYNERHDK